VTHADKVGGAAAVNPDAFSSLNGAPKSQLNIGKPLFYDERILGGKLSKNDDGVTVNTPQGALAIRGGMFMGQIAGPKSAIYSSTVSL
jgi:hypothetical protein